MGIDKMAVCDSKLRVHGIEGLRLADASIMPNITGGNTNAPSIMIGEKAADLVKFATAGSTRDVPRASTRSKAGVSAAS